MAQSMRIVSGLTPNRDPSAAAVIAGSTLRPPGRTDNSGRHAATVNAVPVLIAPDYICRLLFDFALSATIRMS